MVELIIAIVYIIIDECLDIKCDKLMYENQREREFYIKHDTDQLVRYLLLLFMALVGVARG